VTRVVVDASVAVRWFLPEIHAQAAAGALRENHELLAPDLIWAEVGNAFWKKWRRGELSREVARDLLRDFRRVPLEITPSQALLGAAWHIATECGRSIYDSLYIALADIRTCQLITADRKLVNAFKHSPYAARLRWVEDCP
jgi:predicted nucleic acid-binding protein